jgi:DNA-binding beta-propeller fold protein YncE
MSAPRHFLVGTLALGVLVLSSTAAWANQARGPVIGTIGLGEEGRTGGSANGELAAPSGVAIDQSDGDVYVVDSGNNRVEVFSKSGGYLSQFNGGPEHTFSNPTAVTVDQLNGDVYVVDTGNNVVDKFTGTGEYICELSGVGRGCQTKLTEPPTFNVPIGVAVDSTPAGPDGDGYSGDVYISDKENMVVDIFTENGTDVSQFKVMPHELALRPWDLAVDSTGDVFVVLVGPGEVYEYGAGGTKLIQQFFGGVRAVGVDLLSGDFFIGAEETEGEYKIREYDPAGEEVDSFGAGLMSAPGKASPGIAVNAETDTVYAADTGNNVVDMFGEVPVPTATACSAKAITPTSAMLFGDVNPERTRAEYSFRYGTDVNFLASATLFELVAGGAEVTENVPVEAGVTELVPGTRYECKLVASRTFGLFSEGAEGSFETPPLLPTVNEPAAFATDVTTEGAILNGDVNPGNGVTNYHFAYGNEAGHYAQALPSIDTGTGLEPIPVEQVIPAGALKPGTLYHFTLVASNAAGTAVGADQTFTTQPAVGPPDIPPIVGTGLAESVSQSGAVLTGTVVPRDLPTLYEFEIGPTSAYGTVVPGGEVEAESALEDVTVRQLAGNLQPGVTYHFRLVAYNAAGIEFGSDGMFTTAAAPAGIAQPVTLPLISTPVFPIVKYPPIKTKPKKHVKHKKHHGKPKKRSKPRSRARRARTARGSQAAG